MEYLLERVLLLLFNAGAGDFQVAMVEQVGHNLVANASAVGIDVETIYQLHLHLGQLLATMRVGTELGHKVSQLVVKTAHRGIGSDDPPYQCTLAQVLVGRMAIDLRKSTELMDVELVEGSEGDSADEQLLVDGIDRRREKYGGVGIGIGCLPHLRGPDVIEQVGHVLAMGHTELGHLLCASGGGFKR